MSNIKNEALSPFCGGNDEALQGKITVREGGGATKYLMRDTWRERDFMSNRERERGRKGRDFTS